MEISFDVFQALSSINSDEISENDLNFMFDQCNQTIKNDKLTTSSCTENIRILIFAINSLMLEAIKQRINTTTLIRMIKDSGIDFNTNKFKLFENFLEKSMKILDHNVKNIDLTSNPNELQFKDLFWSQWIDIKTSNDGNVRKRNYLINLIGSKQNNGVPTTDSITIKFSEQQLQDFYVTIRDCMKNVENYI